MKCSFEPCPRAAIAKGFCGAHYMQNKKGKRLFLAKEPGTRKPIPHQNGTMLVPLTKGAFAVIDEVDADAVGTKNWCLGEYDHTSKKYAVNSPKSGRLTLHRFLWDVWGMPETPEIDHKNNDGLDCRRENLRAATFAQNRQNVGKNKRNTSGFKGVFSDGNGGWRARIRVNGKRLPLGSFDTAEEAARAYAAAAAKHHGEFAPAEVVSL